MRCIFCKEPSDDSRSVEHILPESLGNEEHILPPGVVCNKCNNYFARKVEKPLLETDFFIHSRLRYLVPNKRGRVQPIVAVHPSSGSVVHLNRDVDDGRYLIYPASEKDNSAFIRSIKSSGRGMLVFPVAKKPDEYLVSRFLAKVALEALAERWVRTNTALDEVIDKEGLDPIRDFAKRGSRNIRWPYNERRVYPEGSGTYDDAGAFGEILHEWDFLYTEEMVLYFVVIIFGIEYAINMGGPEIDGYTKWLDDNDHRSPLYLGERQMPQASNSGANESGT